MHKDDLQAFSSKLSKHIDDLLVKAELPTPLAEQIRSDAFVLGATMAMMIPSARAIDVKLEIFGENTCSRWHQDHYVARSIVSYTGHVGTEYTNDANVDFWELAHCGNNKCVIKDEQQIFGVDVGDFLCIKGTKYPVGATGLVHKAPEVRYHEDGRVVQRLVLKVDVPALADEVEKIWEGKRSAHGNKGSPTLAGPVVQAQMDTTHLQSAQKSPRTRAAAQAAVRADGAS